MERLLRLEDVVNLVGLGKSTIYAHIASGAFPPPVKVGDRAVRWRLSTIEEWMAGLAVEA